MILSPEEAVQILEAGGDHALLRAVKSCIELGKTPTGIRRHLEHLCPPNSTVLMLVEQAAKFYQAEREN